MSVERTLVDHRALGDGLEGDRFRPTFGAAPNPFAFEFLETIIDLSWQPGRIG
jgi:hypothetical protein